MHGYDGCICGFGIGVVPGCPVHAAQKETPFVHQWPPILRETDAAHLLDLCPDSGFVTVKVSDPFLAAILVANDTTIFAYPRQSP